MGIRFACHVCGKHLNIKRDLAGRRGVCPSCQSRFRIPLDDAEKSTPVEAVREVVSQTSPAAVGSTATHPDYVGNEEVKEEGDSHAIGTETSPSRQIDQEGSAIATESQPTASGSVQPTQTHSPTQSNPELAITATTSDVSPSSNDSRGQRDGVPVVSVLDDDPDATWYVRPPSGGQYGPASSDILRKWIGEGRVASTALLWRDGWPQWRDASEAMPELSDQLPKSDSASNSSATSPLGSSDAGVPTESSAASASPNFSGETGIGAERRSRSMRRVLMIGVLTAVAATLIGVLVVVVNR